MLKDKRGLSPVIATVLLITLVLVLASIIFIWMRGFVSEQVTKFDKPAEQTCEKVSFTVNPIQSGTGYQLQLQNTGNIPIYNFDLKKIKSNGNSELELFKISLDPGESKQQEFNPGTSDIIKIIVYPDILGTLKDAKTNKMFTCTNQGKTITL